MRHKLVLGFALALALPAAAWVATFASDDFDHDSVPHQAVRFHLRLLAKGEYHEQTGRWPEHPDDLGETSVARVSPCRRQIARAIEFIPQRELKSDPKENGRLAIAYYSKGLFARPGRVRVCWGDLRTAYVTSAELRKLSGRDLDVR